jgi:hypothetical protein
MVLREGRSMAVLDEVMVHVQAEPEEPTKNGYQHKYIQQGD